MKQKEILLLVISIFLIVAVGIGFNVYHSLISSTISESVSGNIIPIKPNFDLETIQSLKKRNQIQGIYEFSTAPSPTPISTPTPTPPPSGDNTSS